MNSLEFVLYKTSALLTTTMQTIILSCMLAGIVISQDYEDEESLNGLPSGAEDLLSSPYDDSFSCEGQTYGYYGDVSNNCQVFHICLPVEDNEGNINSYTKYSFVCGNGTVFDQQALVCNFPDDAFPCEESPGLYGVVEFGKIEDY